MFGQVTAERLTAFFFPFFFFYLFIYSDHRRREANGNISDGESVVLAWFPNQDFLYFSTFRQCNPIYQECLGRNPFSSFRRNQ